MEFSAGPGPSKAWTLLLLLPVPAALIGAYVIATPPHLSYRVEPERVVIDAGIGLLDQGKVIAKGDISGAEVLEIQRAHRVVGTGMPGYCQGSFDVDGTRAWVAFDCSRSVVRLDTKEGPVFVSPIDRAGFAQAVKAPGGSGEFAAPERPKATWPLMLVPVMLIPLALLPLFLLRVLRPLTYHVEGGELVVPGHFRPIRVGIAGAKVRRGDPGRLLRMAGTGLPGLHLGLYRAFGESVHMASTRRKDLILVEGSRRVVVSPADPEAFLATLRAHGATVA